MASSVRARVLRWFWVAVSVVLVLVPAAPAGATTSTALPQVLQGGQHRVIAVEHRHTLASLPAAAQGAAPVEAPPHRRGPRVDGPARTQGVNALAPSRRPGAGPGAAAAPASTFGDPSIEQLAEWTAGAYDKFAPPDTYLAVGPTRVIEMDNVQGLVYDKAGVQQGSSSWPSRTGPTPAPAGPSTRSGATPRRSCSTSPSWGSPVTRS
jgi:hypothetical protein